MPEHDDILIAILTDRLRLLIQIFDDEQPNMRQTLRDIERALTTYKGHRVTSLLAHAA